MIENIVFSGAGSRIYIFLGFIKALDEHNMLSNIKSVIGTSSGALIAVLCVLDFKYCEIEAIMLKINTSKLKNINSENIINFFNDYGLDDGKNFHRIIKIILNIKVKNENITFKELFELTNKRLIITATCVNNMDIDYFDYQNTPDIPVIKVLLMSISIPIIFKPIKLDNKYYVDGGLISHYPIDFFKDEKDKTLGILVTSSLNKFMEINSIQDYIYNLMSCPLTNLLKNCYNNYKDNTILVENNNINFLDFNLEYNTKISLIEEGYKETIKFLNINSLNIL
jgi:NTE family protein